MRISPAMLATLAALCLSSAAAVEAQDVQATLEGHTNVVAAVCFSPDGKTIVSASWDESVRLWDASNGKTLWTFAEHTDWVETAAISADGRMLATASQRDIHIYDLETRRHIAGYDFHRDFSISATALSPDGTLFACGVRDGRVLVWEVAAEQPKWQFKTDLSWTKCITISSDGKQLAAGNWLGGIRVWNLAENREIHKFEGHPGSVVSALCFNPAGTELASGGYDAAVKLWDVKSGELTQTLTGHDGLILSFAYSRDGSLLASGERHGLIKLWAAGGKLLTTYKAHPDQKLGFSVVALDFSPDGKRLASASYDKTVKLWNVPQP